MESFFKGFGIGLMIIGTMLVFGSVEPMPTASIWQIIAIASTGFILIAFGWRALMASQPRTIFTTKRW